MTLRFATVADVDEIAALHSSRIAESFLATLGPAFLRRLYARIVQSSRAFVLVVDAPGANGASHRVCGFVAVAEDTGALYREFLLRDGIRAGIAATAGIARSPRAVWETTRYGLRGGSDAAGSDVHAEVLSTAVASDCGQQGIATRLVRAAVDELHRRGVASARVVTTVGNLAAVTAYEHGGFRVVGLDEVHSGIAQQLLVWP